MRPLTPDLIRDAVARALEEDVGTGDATTLATIPADAVADAALVAREALVVCGLEFAREAFQQLSPGVECEPGLDEGRMAEPGTRLMRVRGPARAILTGERVALNFTQRLSGVATLTARYAERLKGLKAKLLDTRKTLPGWRLFDKYAVACGGGQNHRFGLHDMVMIKDNHLAALRGAKPNPIAAAVARCREMYPALRVEVEADTLTQAEQAAEAGADIILLDNMPPAMLRAAVALVAGRSRTEASGGVTLETIRGIGECGVDFVSVGAVTHSARAVDIGLDFLD